MIVIPILILLIIIFYKPNSPKIKGKIGENQVSRKLKKLDTQKYKVLNNLFITLDNGFTSQIDHVIISKYGIFVIETKNYSGWIFGREKSENWTQVVFQQKKTFRNPIKQNQAHVYALKEILKKINNIRFISIVVFSDKATFKDLRVNSSVVYTCELINEIYNYSTSENLSEELINEIVQILNAKNIKSSKKQKEHINSINTRVVNRHLKEANLICPRCNSALVKRYGKYGSFYGCSNFPHCKFTCK